MAYEHMASGGVCARLPACMHNAHINNVILKGMLIKNARGMLNVIKVFNTWLSE